MRLSLAKMAGGMMAGKSGVQWQPAGRPYPRLLDFVPGPEGLLGREGIYAIWHLGVRPQWLRVGAALNLGTALHGLTQADWVAAHRDNAGVFLAWASPPQNQCIGMVRYLAETLTPAFQDRSFPGDRTIDLTAAAVVCPLPPGTQR